MSTNRMFVIVVMLALVLGTGSGAAAGWVAGQSSTASTGIPGSDGADGNDGPAGSPGTPGANGAPGADGTPGPRGPSGARGPQGERGATGQAGAPGVQGQQGAQGQTGPQGAPGTDGILPYAFIAFDDVTLAAGGGVGWATSSGTQRGTVDLATPAFAHGWKVTEAGLYRVTSGSVVHNPDAGYVVAYIEVGPDQQYVLPRKVATENTTIPALLGGTPITLTQVEQLSAGDVVGVVYLAKSNPQQVLVRDGYVLFEKIE